MTIGFLIGWLGVAGCVIWAVVPPPPKAGEGFSGRRYLLSFLRRMFLAAFIAAILILLGSIFGAPAGFD